MTRRLLLCFIAALCAATASAQFTINTIAGSRAGGGWQDGALRVAMFSQPQHIVADAVGNLYVTDLHSATVRRVGRDGLVTTIAGTAGVADGADGGAGAGHFVGPYGIAMDASGNIFVADQSARTIRKISRDGYVSTFAGLPGFIEHKDGKGSEARFEEPRGIACCDGSGNLYVIDSDWIRKIAPDGTVSHFAGSDYGYADGPALQAKFARAKDLAIDAGGNIFVADQDNYVIRKIATDGTVSTFAGSGTYGSSDGVGSAATFGFTTTLDFDAAGNLYVGESTGLLRRIAPDARVTTVAGKAEVNEARDGIGTQATFGGMNGIAFDRATGSLFIADTDATSIRRFDPATSAVTTYAGSAPERGSTDGPASLARFTNPHTVVRDSLGNLFVSHDHAIRKITPAGVVSTFAGNSDTEGAADGTGTAARFSSPFGLAIDAADNLYVGDSGNSTVRKITPAGVVTTLAGSPKQQGKADGLGSAARFQDVGRIIADAAGNVYVPDFGNHNVRKVDPAGMVTTIAGSGAWGFDDGPVASATFASPVDVALDAAGNVYVVDFDTGNLRKIANGQVTTIIESTGGAVAIAPDGRIYMAGYGPVLRVGADKSRQVVAGEFLSVGNVDGTGKSARFSGYITLRFDAAGNLLVADTKNENIRIGTFERPRVLLFSATPSGSRQSGDVTLKWVTTGLSVAIDGVGNNFGPSGSFTVHPAQTTTYRLTVTGDGGTTVDTVRVTIANPPPKRRAAGH